MTESAWSQAASAPALRECFRPARVLIVGDVMLDRYWFGDVERISPEAPVPVVRVQRTEMRLGGAANVALNVRSLGAGARLMGVVGRDEAGGEIRQMLDRHQIDARLTEDPESPTTVKLRVIGRQQQLLRIDFEQPPAHATLAGKLDAVRQALGDDSVLVLSDYGKGALLEVSEMIAAARDHRRTVIVDPKGDDYARYRGATVITPNRAELREVVGRWRDEDDLTRRAQALRAELDIDHLLLTRSEEGMSLYGADGVWSVAAAAREVFDVSGAGDTVVAVMAAALAAGAPIREAVTLANRAGGIVVGKLGTATVSAEELFEK
ncbi:MAG: D-glycero-beta-D-manno-heptose-7-phosphate kinase [Burkholderiaceae bacterium]